MRVLTRAGSVQLREFLVAALNFGIWCKFRHGAAMPLPLTVVDTVVVTHL